MKIKEKVIFSGLLTTVVCALVGSITGTFAWYGYATRATLDMTGTSFGEASNLQLGIVTTNETVANPEYDAQTNPDVPQTITQGKKINNLQDPDANNICWAPIGGGLKLNAINSYLSNEGFSTNNMKPSTSGRTTEDVANPAHATDPSAPETIERNIDIQPKEMAKYQYNSTADAAKADYVVLPLAIRVSDLQGNYRRNTNIYLSDIDVTYLNKDEYDSTLKSGLRIDFKTWNNANEVSHVILNPGSQEESGTTKLGGLLDLNGDGYVDVEQIDYEYKVRDELLYGAVKSVNWRMEQVINPEHATDPEAPEYIDGPNKHVYQNSDAIAVDAARPVHLSENYDERNHQGNTHTVLSYEAYEQSWKGALKNNGTNNGLIASFDSQMRLENGTPLCSTGDEALVYCTLTIWLEGWDENINDTTLGVEYGLGIQFQIDRVD